MAITTVHDTSEAVELNTTHHLYLKPRARLVITVVLPEDKDPCRPISNWEVVEQVKNLVTPDHFSYLKVTKSAKGFIRLESETDSKHLAHVFLAKLDRQGVSISSFNEPLRVEVSESPLEFPTAWALHDLTRESEKEHVEEGPPPPCIHVDGMPCKWFSTLGSGVEKPSEDILRSVFEKYGPLAHIDIPILDPYREEAVGSSVSLNPVNLQTFDAFIQYEDKASCVGAMQSLEGMKLMFMGEDGKSLSCDIKVTLDTTDHFSEEAISRRNAERLKLQELEQQRKREKEEEELKRKRKALEQKYRARRRRAKLKRRLQKQKSTKQRTVQDNDISADVVEDTQEWEDRKLLLAHRRVESIKLLTLLLDKVTELVQIKALGEEPMDCDVTEECSEYSISSCSSKTQTTSPTEEGGNKHKLDNEEEMESDFSKSYLQNLHKHPVKRRRKSFPFKNHWKGNGDYLASRELENELENVEIECFDHQLLKLPRTVVNESCYKRLKVYETDEFINYLLNYYQCPEYARLFLNTSDGENEPWCQRLVLCNGNGFRVKLKNANGHLAEIEYVSETESQLAEDCSEWKNNSTKPTKHSKSTTNPRMLSDEFQDHSAEGEQDETLVGVRSDWTKDKRDYRVRVWKGGEDTQSSESDHELKDVLEEISSTSEYFSEELSDDTPERPLNVRKVQRKQRNVTRVKQVKTCCFSEHENICRHRDFLGRFLHSYTVRKSLKKHLRRKQLCACQGPFHPVYNMDAAESDTEVETEDGLVWKRKKNRKKTLRHCLAEDKSNHKASSLSDSSQSDSWAMHHKEREKHVSRRTGCDPDHRWKSKRQPGHWGYYCQGDDSPSSEEDEPSSIEQGESTSPERGESSLDYGKSQERLISRPRHKARENSHQHLRSKSSFNDYLDWEQYFYC